MRVTMAIYFKNTLANKETGNLIKNSKTISYVLHNIQP